jgi:large subunit ribosomal protein L21
MAETKTKKTAKKAPAKKTAAKKPAAKKTTKKSTKKSGSFAVIFTGGKQYKVHEGDIFAIEKLPKEHKEGSKITFDKVLLTDNGKDTKIGDPYIKSAKVEAEVIKNTKAKKITVIHYRSKSRHFIKKGHKQHQVVVKITKV